MIFCKKFLILLSFSLQICWENRFIDDVGNDCLVSVDGYDFRIAEQSPWSKIWYLHKFCGPGLRYKIGLAVRKGLIVWTKGPFPCGLYSGLNFFKGGMQRVLGRFERVEADSGYSGCDPEFTKTPKSLFVGGEERQVL